MIIYPLMHYHIHTRPTSSSRSSNMYSSILGYPNQSNSNIMLWQQSIIKSSYIKTYVRPLLITPYETYICNDQVKPITPLNQVDPTKDHKKCLTSYNWALWIVLIIYNNLDQQYIQKWNQYHIGSSTYKVNICVSFYFIREQKHSSRTSLKAK